MIKQLKARLVKLVKMGKAGQNGQTCICSRSAASEAKAGNGVLKLSDALDKSSW